MSNVNALRNDSKKPKDLVDPLCIEEVLVPNEGW